jgi:hypothetical protein
MAWSGSRGGNGARRIRGSRLGYQVTDARGSGAMIFEREDFDRRRPDGGNKSTA